MLPVGGSEIVTLSRTKSENLLPCGCLTVDRLPSYLAELRGTLTKHSRIVEPFQLNGWYWRTWFGEQLEPAIAESMGP